MSETYIPTLCLRVLLYGQQEILQQAEMSTGSGKVCWRDVPRVLFRDLITDEENLSGDFWKHEAQKAKGRNRKP